MNIQAMMKQMNNLKNEMIKTKEEIDNMVFEEKNEIFFIKVNGKKEVVDFKILLDKKIEKEDFEMMEDYFIMLVNNAFKKVDKFTDEKMSKYSSMAPGFF